MDNTGGLTRGGAIEMFQLMDIMPTIAERQYLRQESGS